MTNQLPLHSFPQRRYMRNMVTTMPGVKPEQEPQANGFFQARMLNGSVIPIIILYVFECFVPPAV
jgi:hypothetical protein